jgi:hypothetical protein
VVRLANNRELQQKKVGRCGDQERLAGSDSSRATATYSKPARRKIIDAAI